MSSTPSKRVLRFVYLPRRPDGKPVDHAIRHLVEFDENNRLVRFHRQKTGKLLLAAGGEEVVEERRSLRRIKHYIERMKSMGFYQDR